MRFAITLLLAIPVLAGAPLTPTSTTVSSSANPSQYGHAVTLTAAVTPSSATGNVTFYNGAAVLGTSPLTSGQATFTTNLLPAGANPIKARYDGDMTNAGSLSAALSQTVNAMLSGGFTPAVNYGPVTFPRSIAVGDFNNDGKADLVVANYFSANISVLLGNGNGSFQLPTNNSVGLYPSSVAVGDFNGDGNSDIAVANAGSDFVSVLLGNGNGTFQAAVSYTAASNVRSVAIGDFNGDGIADLVVANVTSNNISVMLGKGDGTFLAAVNYPVGNGPTSVAVADFNGDGHADVVVANQEVNSVAVLMGKGDGTFQAAAFYGAGPGSAFVTVGDFNADGKPDLAVAGGDALSVLLNKGDGTFQTAVSYGSFGGPASVDVADFNGDGKLDLAVANQVLLGNGNGTFQAPVIFSPVGLDAIVAGDFNHDGRTDLAAANLNSNTVTVLLGTAATESTTTLTFTPDATHGIAYGQSVLLTATVVSGGAFVTPPSGMVNFLDGTTVIGTSALVDGVATFQATGLLSGPHTISADYLGNMLVNPSMVSAMVNVTGGPLWSITKTHTGTLTQGQTGATYTITVQNTGVLFTTGTVTVTDTPPSGLTVTSMSGGGWTCTGSSCTRNEGLVAGNSYPPITVLATVNAHALTPQINMATVSGGGAVSASASDSTTIESSVTPFGNIDTPVNNATGIAGAVGVTGWAISGVGIQSIGIYRARVTGEAGTGLVFLGTAQIIPGARPDVAMAYPGFPQNDYGWGFQILTNELPDSNGQPGVGNGTYVLHALITDNGGRIVDLGTKTITVNNATSVLPFGTIDTPPQGGVASGSAYINFGWALTPLPNTIPTNGSTITVYIDKHAVGHPTYNNFRTDIATLFPGLNNSQGAVGYFYIDTTQLTNGLHTISWVVTDNANHTSGLGSRFFIVQN